MKNVVSAYVLLQYSIVLLSLKYQLYSKLLIHKTLSTELTQR